MEGRYVMVWMALLTLRLGWSILPQTGYIHPDEFFQTVEVIAGDVFNTSVVRTWEFQHQFPLRSIVLPKLIFSPVYHALKLSSEYWTGFRLSSYTVIACSRFVMACLSLIVDYVVNQTSRLLTSDKGQSLCLLASSYVMLTYQTHSFTNSLETLLLVIVIYIAIKTKMKCSLIDSKELSMTTIDDMKNKIEKTESKFRVDAHYVEATESMKSGESENEEIYASQHSEQSSQQLLMSRKKGSKQKAGDFLESEVAEDENSEDVPNDSESSEAESKCEKLTKFKCSGAKLNVSSVECIVLAVVNTAGVFNRPTFLLFSFCPMLLWIIVIANHEKVYRKCVTVLFLSAVITAAIFCATDTIYYCNLTITDIFREPEILYNSTKLTIYNFILYNIQTTNLESHGRHPHYLHFLVNLTLLFGPMVIYIILLAYRVLGVPALKIVAGVINQWRRVDSSKAWQEASEMEMWLLGTILFPVFCLSLFPHQEPRFLIPLLPIVVISVIYMSNNLGKVFLSGFVLFNVLLAVVYGSLHQGGVIPCLMKLQGMTEHRLIEAAGQSVTVGQPVTVIFSHTYMPPKHILLSHDSDVELIDLAGDGDWIALNRLLYTNIHKTKLPSKPDKYTLRNVTYFVCPGTVKDDFIATYSEMFNIVLIEQFFPHLSMEDPPVIGDNFTVDFLMDQMSLYLFQIQLQSNVS